MGRARFAYERIICANGCQCHVVRTLCRRGGRTNFKRACELSASGEVGAFTERVEQLIVHYGVLVLAIYSKSFSAKLILSSAPRTAPLELGWVSARPFVYD